MTARLVGKIFVSINHNERKTIFSVPFYSLLDCLRVCLSCVFFTRRSQFPARSFRVYPSMLSSIFSISVLCDVLAHFLHYQTESHTPQHIIRNRFTMSNVGVLHFPAKLAHENGMSFHVRTTGACTHHTTHMTNDKPERNEMVPWHTHTLCHH